jgi:replicative DNA helicase
LEAERALLGSILLDNSALNMALEVVGRDDFFSEAHRITFEKMVGISEKNRTIDLVTLSEELSKDGQTEKAGGAAYLFDALSMRRTTLFHAVWRERMIPTR